ncbi:tagaturonate reductase [Butyrivibrio sp. XB500-5]|uniref:tagaturonate reductase n=1 Tax=Butyrivibrio sp. XB500-5 TaxID=2364880 RepID=UPI000EA95F8E|nr:tagaturonate reductase [Butyrivibrio sp. XB500-5]RKM62778.1 tagaturonate reductase [Butyrivibrio sp. XB500-5]
MKQLNYDILEKSGYKGYALKDAPIKVLQFGEGNFLRAFVDFFFDMSNEKAGFDGKVMLVQPIAQGLTDIINKQEGLYTLYLRGSENGKKIDNKRVISAVKSCVNPYDSKDYQKMLDVATGDDLDIIVSNTTEAGISFDPSCKMNDIPANSFPGKLTQVLYARFKAGKKGVVVLSCELIDNNGKELLKCVNEYIDLWGLSDDFKIWVNESNIFCSTLVDRIVPGRIRDEAEIARLEDENGYHDELIDVGEIFGVWIIEGPKELEDRLPFKRAGVNVHVVPDVMPYKHRKVRILNGAHTGFVLGAYLAGEDIVRDCMNNKIIAGFMNKMLEEEVIPTMTDHLDEKDLNEFAAAVKDRFNNPFVNHELMSISLNSTSKWKARNMPSFLGFIEKNGKLPVCLTMSLAAYIAFYSSNIKGLNDKGLVCERPSGNEYVVSDDRWVLEFYNDKKDASEEELVRAVLGNTRMWDMDLNEIDGLTDLVVDNLKTIKREGALKAYESCL